MKRHVTLLCTALTLSLFTSNAFAALSTPAGLSPGDSFHWVFVTSTDHNAVPSDIGVYNTFVNNVADNASLTLSNVDTGGGLVTALGDIDWFAIASTETVDARDNIGDPISPIYRLDGVRVAADEDALWNTDSVDLLAPINVDETLTPGILAEVWTGSIDDGTANFPLGGTSSFSTFGSTSSTSSTWLAADGSTPGTAFPFYAISEQLTVSDPQVIPLPGSVVLGLIGLMSSSMALSRSKRRAIGASN